ALATAFAAAEGKPEAFAQAVTSLLAAVEVNPLEELPPGTRANARQRAAALPQVGLWVAARDCLKREELRDAGAKLGERALAAAKRQLDKTAALSILREWGEAELARGDKAAAERRWAQMLELVLPEPKKPAAKGAAFVPPSPPASVGVVDEAASFVG